MAAVKHEQHLAKHLSLEALSAPAKLPSAGKLLESGNLIHVSAWCRFSGASFGPRMKRPKIWITPKVLVVLQDIPKAMWQYYTVRGRGGELLVLAARALIHARRRFEVDEASFIYALPTETDTEDAKLFRIEFIERSGGRDQVVIGLQHEFLDG